MRDPAAVEPECGVVVADDDDAVREALGNLIEAHPAFSVVGRAPDGFEAARLCGDKQPRLAVVDVMMPGGGVAAVAAIHAVSPGTVIAAYTARSDRRTRQQLIAAGAAEVFAKGDAIDLVSELQHLIDAKA